MKSQETIMAKPIFAAPQTKKPTSPVRLPQRSEEISGDERHDAPKPIAAAQDKSKAKSH
jgi:hypothetical protein